MRRFLLLAMVLGAASGAQAADMPDFLRGSLPAGPPPITNWQGWYIGGQGSYGTDTSQVSPSLNNDLRAQPIAPAGFNYTWANLSQAKDVAGGYGAFAGYNGQWDDVVAGIEANYMHTNYAALTTGIGVDPSGAITNSRALVSLTDFGSIRPPRGLRDRLLPALFVRRRRARQPDHRPQCLGHARSGEYPDLQQYQGHPCLRLFRGLWRGCDDDRRIVHARRIRIPARDGVDRNDDQLRPARHRL